MDKNKSLEDYLVKPGEQSPFANLLVDLAFKKAFDPDKPTSRENLVNLLNDLLAPQLKRPIKNVWTRNVAKNLSGSRASRSTPAKWWRTRPNLELVGNSTSSRPMLSPSRGTGCLKTSGLSTVRP